VQTECVAVMNGLVYLTKVAVPEEPAEMAVEACFVGIVVVEEQE